MLGLLTKLCCISLCYLKNNNIFLKKNDSSIERIFERLRSTRLLLHSLWRKSASLSEFSYVFIWEYRQVDLSIAQQWTLSRSSPKITVFHSSVETREKRLTRKGHGSDCEISDWLLPFYFTSWPLQYAVIWETFPLTFYQGGWSARNVCPLQWV